MPADLILQSATVHTVDAARRTAAAVAIEAGRIAAVGDADEVDGLRGPATRVVDLDGGMVLPGFQDAHCHLGSSGHASRFASLEGSRGADEHLRRIGAYRDAHPDREWIVGSGWSMSDFPGGIADGGGARRRRTRPAGRAHQPRLPRGLGQLARARGGGDHGGDARSARAGGSSATSTARPWGRSRSRPCTSSSTARRDRHTPIAWPGSGPAPRTITASGSPPARTRSSIPAGRPPTRSSPTPASSGCACAARSSGTLGRGEEQVAELVERRRSGTLGRLACGNVKFFHDGVVENRTAAMLDPYLNAAGGATAEHGIDMYDRADLERFVRLCDAEGFGVHIHTIGDRAVRESLDTIEAAARANGRRDARHQLAHVQFAHPDDLPRFRALGVIANVTPLWARLEAYVAEMTLPFVSARAGAGMYPFASIVRAGGALAFGSDWSVSTPTHATSWPSPSPGAIRRAPQTSRSSRRSGSTWALRSPPTPSAPRTPAGSTRLPDRSSPASWRTSWCSTVICSRWRRTSTCRRASSPRFSRARSSTRSRARLWREAPQPRTITYVPSGAMRRRMRIAVAPTWMQPLLTWPIGPGWIAI